MSDEPTRYGFPAGAWEVAKAQAEDALAAAARSRSTITYAGLCERVTAVRLRPYSFALVAFLDEVCTEQDERLGIVSASLVVRKDTGLPGDGYFRHATLSGRRFDSPEDYWRAEVDKVYAAFAEEAS